MSLLGNKYLHSGRYLFSTRHLFFLSRDAINGNICKLPAPKVSLDTYAAPTKSQRRNNDVIQEQLKREGRTELFSHFVRMWAENRPLQYSVLSDFKKVYWTQTSCPITLKFLHSVNQRSETIPL